jgi:hypothetical protein
MGYVNLIAKMKFDFKKKKKQARKFNQISIYGLIPRVGWFLSFMKNLWWFQCFKKKQRMNLVPKT